MKLFGTMMKNESGSLEIGGCNSLDLVREYGSPLYVMDEKLIRENCRTFINGFKSDLVKTDVAYASKAFLTKGICKIIDEEGLSLDVVSGGELYTAIKANFPTKRIHMHGNNKTESELRLAIENKIGRIVVDNKFEFELIEEICEELNTNIEVLLRVNPGVDAHTHEFIQTANDDSKFGESIYAETTYDFINQIKNSETVNLLGFHCHIGSQIFENTSFYKGAKVMIDFLKKVKIDCDFETEELNLGGGFGVYYSEEDKPVDLQEFLGLLIEEVKLECEKIQINIPKLIIEPGRSIVANAGTTLYKVGGIKETYGGRKYIFIDGGMSDNIRTALYDAKYEAAIANKLNSKPDTIYTIAGKCCESGDIIVNDIMLPKPDRGDILAVSTTGAYNYSMASNYNRLPRPAVVFVKDGVASLAVKRESYEDIIKNDLMF